MLFYDWTGSYGISLLLFCLVIRLILFPVFLKGRKSMLSMSGLADKQRELAQKYARNREKYSQELQKLYEEEGVKPSGGGLWSFLPLPFLMVLYLVIRKPLEYLMGINQDQFNAITNLLNGTVMDYEGNGQLAIAQDVFLEPRQDRSRHPRAVQHACHRLQLPGDQPLPDPRISSSGSRRTWARPLPCGSSPSSPRPWAWSPCW